MEISKSAVLLANEHQSDQKKRLQIIFVKIFAMYLFTQKGKNDAVNGIPECSIWEDFNKMVASVFHRI